MFGTSGKGGRPLARVLTVGGIGSMAAGMFLFPTAAHAAFSGTDGPIVFSSNRTATTPFCPGPYNGNELFLVSPGGGTASQLTCTGQQDNHPFVSPDGTQVVFSSTRAGGSSLLYTIAEDTNSGVDATVTAPTLVSVLPAGATSVTDDYPSWSPAGDGTIIFQRTINGGTPQLWTENVNNPGPTAAPVFSTSTGFSDTEPVYDPLNSSVIAFVRSTGGTTQIFDYNLSTPFTPPVNLSAAGDGGTASNDSKPDFAPNQGPNNNSQRIVFQSDRACGQLQLYTMEDNGTNQMPVFQQTTGGVPNGIQLCTAETDENPVYSPQADAIAYDRPGADSQDVYDAYYVDVSHMTAAISTPNDLTPNFATDDQPNWGPVSPGASTPESPFALLLPIAGAGLLAGGVVTSLRRPRRQLTA